MIKIHTFLIITLMVVANCAISQNSASTVNQNGFTQADRDLLTRTVAILEQHEKRLDEMHADFDRRFESVDKSIDRLYYLFGGITLFLIGLVVWDRRTWLRPLENKVKVLDLEMEELKKGTRLEKVIAAFREMANDNPKIAEVLKNNNLL